MNDHAKPSKGRRSFLDSPLWGHDTTWSGPAPVAFLALGVFASRAGVLTRGLTIGGSDLVRWKGRREQFLASGLFDKVRFPMRAGQVRTKEGLIGRIRALGDGFEIVVTGYAMPRSPRAALSLLKHARADAAFRQFLERVCSCPAVGDAP